MKRFIVSLLLVCMTCSYAAGQKNQRPAVQTPPTYRADPSAQPDAQTLATLKWFELVQAETPQDLIRDALTHNYDLRHAAARTDAARPNLGIPRSDQFATIGASADVINQRQSRSSSAALPEAIKRDRSFRSVLLNLLTY